METCKIQPLLNESTVGRITSVAPLINPYWPKAIVDNDNEFLHCRLLSFYKIPFLDRRCAWQQYGSNNYQNPVNQHWPKALVPCRSDNSKAGVSVVIDQILS
ncbi:hypothetical protein LJ739_13670 [Aestuariibacter halophilus]|uniref:Uncharacterized protein n=1 Tax=Fluctibacter halophilus TaxID=226011 RepID=A0ABS8G9P1_9ALTE|nr:hypothetical protein [Aestuariibacter halophilus]MCC2617297.1 hypothetical protein [Aestuariibacter halophilus]